MEFRIRVQNLFTLRKGVKYGDATYATRSAARHIEKVLALKITRNLLRKLLILRSNST